LKYNTKPPKLDGVEPTVLLKSIRCTCLSADEQGNDVNSLDVMFHLTTAEGFSHPTLLMYFKPVYAEIWV
jgi:hypothetical protein